MLQQTQVATALQFYQRFIGRFPTVMSLARAREPQVLALWAGLGYYRRARHLHAAARVVAREHGGRVPDDPERFAALPGVGRYTAGAVLSIAFGRPLPVLDGNVARVLSRLFAIPAAVRDPAGARRLWRVAATLVPMRGAGDWNQALMELGATVCTFRLPRCGECPVRVHCHARVMERVAEFPPAFAPRAPTAVRRAVVIVARDGRVLVQRRRGPLLEGLWEPPGVELATAQPAAAPLARALAALGIRAPVAPTGARVRHVITHRRIEVELWRAAAPQRFRPAGDLAWVDPARPARPLTALAVKAARAAGLLDGASIATAALSARTRAAATARARAPRRARGDRSLPASPPPPAARTPRAPRSGSARRRTARSA